MKKFGIAMVLAGGLFCGSIYGSNGTAIEAYSDGSIGLASYAPSHAYGGTITYSSLQESTQSSKTGINLWGQLRNSISGNTRSMLGISVGTFFGRESDKTIENAFTVSLFTGVDYSLSPNVLIQGGPQLTFTTEVEDGTKSDSLNLGVFLGLSYFVK